MHAESVEEIKKHVRGYWMIFTTLAALTVLTVAVSSVHLPVHVAIIVALIIASVKGSLVALYFMHLVSEEKIIYWVLALTVVFFVVLMLLPSFTSAFTP